jgi:ABC-type phosphate transport system permease subunit
MAPNPFVKFHRNAEAAGYPALFVVSVFSLALVVTPVALLALTRAGWALALALLSIPVALVTLAGALEAAFSEREEPSERDGSAALAGVDGEPAERAVVRDAAQHSARAGHDTTAV